MAASGAAQANAAESPWGQLVSLCDEFSTFPLLSASVVVGRNAACDVYLRNPVISGCHCVIERDFSSEGKEMVHVTDKSLNGTYVNDARLAKGVRTPLVDGAELSFGKERTAANPIKFMLKSFNMAAPSIHDIYQIGDTLGTGAFAVVKRAVHKRTGKLYAVKIVDKRKLAMVHSSRDLVKAEVEVLRSCQHRHIVKFYGMYDSKRYLHIVLEFVDGGELFDKIIESGTFPEMDAKALFRQIAKAIAYLHERNISHRDLKPENILLKKIVHHVPGEAEPSVRWLAKISDFGVSRVVSDMGCQTMAGTPQYLAPEIIRSANGGGSAYDHRVDMWSLGVILYILLAGTQPFSDTPAMSVMDQILNGRYEFPARKWGHISREAKQLVRRLLTVDPNKRITAAELLAHPWLARTPPPPSPAPSRGLPAGGSSVTLRYSRTTQSGASSAASAASGDELRLGASASVTSGDPGFGGGQSAGGVATASSSAQPQTAGSARSLLSTTQGGSSTAASNTAPDDGSDVASGAVSGVRGGVGFSVQSTGSPASTGRRRSMRVRTPRSGASSASDDGGAAGGNPFRSQLGRSNNSADTLPSPDPTGALPRGSRQPARKRKARGRASAAAAAPSDDASASGGAGSGTGASASASAGSGAASADPNPGTPKRRRRTRRRNEDGDEPPDNWLESPTAPVVRQQPVCPYGARCYRTRNPKHVTEFFHPHLA